jgi:hypothetical protein
VDGPCTASATPILFPTDFLVSADFPMGFLTLYATVPHALAPPATLHRAETIYFLAVGAHQPTPNPTLLGPLRPSAANSFKGHPLPLGAGAHARAQILTVLGDPP